MHHLVFVLFIVVFLAAGVCVPVEAKVLSEEDFLLAQIEVQSLNYLDPRTRAEHEPREIGVDPRTGKTVFRDYVCGGICPDNGRLFLRYGDVDDVESCRALRGDPVYPSGGEHVYSGCRPHGTKIKIFLSSRKRIEGVLYAGHPPRYFLRFIKRDVSNEDPPPTPVRSVWINDIESIISSEGERCERVEGELLGLAPVDADPGYRAKMYLKEASGRDARSTYSDEEIVVLCEKAITLDPRLSKAYHRIRGILGMRDPSVIVRIFGQYIKYFPDDAFAFQILGTACAYKADARDKEDPWGRQSVRMLERALKLRPDDKQTLYRISQYYANFPGIHLLAARAMTRYLEIAHLSDANRRAREKELGDFRRRAEKDLLAEGKVLRWEGHFDRAIVELQASVDRYPEKDFYGRAKAWSQVALAYKDKGDTDRAIKAFEKTIAMASSYYKNLIPPAHIQIGLLHKKRGDRTRAKESFEKAIEGYREIMRESGKSKHDDEIEKVRGMMP